jgi:hypothetical protein
MLENFKRYTMKLDGIPHVLETMKLPYGMVYGKLFSCECVVEFGNPEMVSNGCLVGFRLINPEVITLKRIGQDPEIIKQRNAMSFKVTDLKLVR